MPFFMPAKMETIEALLLGVSHPSPLAIRSIRSKLTAKARPVTRRRFRSPP
jgi:hypothetical protein